MTAWGEITPQDVAAMIVAASQTSGVVVAADGSMQPLEAAQLAAPDAAGGEDG